MGTRYSAAVGYAGGAVNVEIDVAVTTAKEYDESTGRWRNPDGTFAKPPTTDAYAVEQRAKELQQTFARNAQSPELASAVANAQLSIEDGEQVGGARETETEVIRVDPHGDGDYIRYVPNGRGGLKRL